jgi:putative salt-induced outer membrane protein YdiY
MRRICTTIILLLLAGPAFADLIVTTDGSRLNGEITGGTTKAVVIKTAFGAEVEVPLGKVKTLSTGQTVHLALSSGNVLVGTVEDADGQMQVSTGDGTMSVKSGAITAVWRPGSRNPLLPPPVIERKWKYEASVDVSGKTGNTEKMGSYVAVKGTLAGDDDKFVVYARGGRSRENSVDTVKEVIGGLDYEEVFGDASSWYARTELEYDSVENVDLRSTAAAGYGYYLVRQADHEARLRVGFQFRHESFGDGTNESSPGLDFGLYNMAKFEDFGTLTTEITYTPSFEDFSDYRAYHESSLDIPLPASDRWSIRLGISNEYNSHVKTDRKHLDTSYFARLALKWE